MRDYFCGWYFKCQSDTKTLAIIPAIHKSKNNQSCSIQLITDENAYNICFPYEDFTKQNGDFRIRINKNYFGKEGIKLNLHTSGFSATGLLRFGTFSPIRYDIMGPFRYVPLMECRHSVVSMKHSVNGEICINGVKYRLSNAIGYIEGDRGYSFPKEYAWTQCHFKDGSLMLSVADIPFGAVHFTGVIGVIQYNKKEYRLATYLGAKAIKIENGEIIINQGNMTLSVRLIKKHAHPLFAPVSGAMTRTIHESASCSVSYCLKKNARTIFFFETSHASFEYEYPY